ncbi:Holliday junction resolvase RuvX [Buchnera aphidicola]|uniref:Putative pre-16S rRNA nuclease n=1 Tax=Buchnera aphidicola (Sarucallis kahawaluokalani) TaxID=1241878 RepID=A0A4D6YAI5_9GAMM|nr:Holliday junction resolvase RuvX [Buchnera aphidicola]QCI26152.1 Holliday junction resolvase RuvX [Buchnera aphidicola (Sarucallis kahawaluokalani)]
MLILSFDFGTKNIGAAIGQNITYTAHALNSIKVIKGIPDWKKISYLIKYWMPKLIIVGYPLHMDGSKQKMTQKTIIFSKLLKKKYHIDVQLHDERLTTIEAKSILYTNGGYKKLKKKNIDSLSAALILESWFQKTKFKKI